MDQICNLKTQIIPSYKRKVLLKGVLPTSLGASLLLIGGTCCSVQTLTTWGLPIFIGSLLLIRTGLLPYRKICQKELSYDQILVRGTSLHYVSKMYEPLVIPFKRIRTISYRKSHPYGICISFQETPSDKALKTYQVFSQKKYESDCFFPYFSEKAFLELKTCLNHIVQS